MNLLLIGHGYIGSYLCSYLVQKGHCVTVCSYSITSKSSDQIYTINSAYQDLSPEFLANFEKILWFAGHSSVAKALEDPIGAIANNCTDLLKLAQIKPDTVPLIYASTASLYSFAFHSGEKGKPALLSESEARLNSQNIYDSSKAAFDTLVGPLVNNTCGLRMGTLCGYSPRLREELVFNAMNLSALRNGVLNVANQNAWRGLLFLDDLANIIDVLVEMKEVPARFINLASMNIEIGSLAEKIAHWYKVKINVLPSSKTYSFRVSNDIMLDLLGSTPQKTLEDQCEKFMNDIIYKKRT